MGEIHYLDIDISDLDEKIKKIKLALTADKADRLLHDVCVDTAKSVKTIVSRTVPKNYAITKKWAAERVGRYKIENGSQFICAIPLSSKRGLLGGVFKVRGKTGRPVKGKRYKISAKILKGAWGVLPEKILHQGKNPPFIGKNNLVFTRTRKTPRPIARVPGLALPQMPLNKSENEVRKLIHEKMEMRLDHHFNRFLGT